VPVTHSYQHHISPLILAFTPGKERVFTQKEC